MPLDDAIAAWRAGLPRRPTSPLTVSDIPDLRSGAMGYLASSGPAVAVGEVLDLVAPTRGGGIPVRVYRPAHPAPLLAAYVHGGGWVAGSIELADRICRRLAVSSGATVASVGYRLAPEHPYPAALHDCHDAVRWLMRDHDLGLGDRELVLVGESTGGALAAAVSAVLSRHDDPRTRRSVARQVLVYPALDDRLSGASYAEHGQADDLLTTETMRFYWRQYVGGEADEWAAPGRMTELRDLPPTTVFVCDCDPLRDEGIAYAEAVADAGVSTTLVVKFGLPHAALYLDGVSAGAAGLLDDVAAAISARRR